MTNTKDMHYIIVLYGILLGSIVGATVWLFLVTINIGSILFGVIYLAFSLPPLLHPLRNHNRRDSCWFITKILWYISTSYARGYG